MKSPTGELLSLHPEANAEPEHSGYTGALELYDELIDFLGLSGETKQPATGHEATVEAIGTVGLPQPAQPASRPTPANHAGAASTGEPHTARAAANSGALSQSEDVIGITGSLAGFAASKTAGSAMIVCGDCGNRSDSGEMFCIHCGGLLEDAAASAETAIALAGLCDDCGAAVESDEIFCPSCGSVMATD